MKSFILIKIKLNKTLNGVRSEILKNDFVYDEMTCYSTEYTYWCDKWSNNLIKSVKVETPYGSDTMSGEYLAAYNEMFGPCKEDEKVHYCDFPAKAMIKSVEMKIGGDTVSKWENDDDELEGTGGRL